MMTTGTRRTMAAGISLVETMVAVGVLAVVIPLALATMSAVGQESLAARAETRAPAMAEYFRQELAAAREGRSRNFPEIAAGEAFPPGGGTWCLGFDRSGGVLGRVDAASYAQGLSELGDENVLFLATARGRTEAAEGSVLNITVEIEYPAVRRAEDRKRLPFHTKLP